MVTGVVGLIVIAALWALMVRTWRLDRERSIARAREERLAFEARERARAARRSSGRMCDSVGGRMWGSPCVCSKPDGHSGLHGIGMWGSQDVVTWP